MSSISIRRALLAVLLSANLATAHAQPNVSDASALSALPIAVSIAAPVMIISAGAALSVVAIQASATGSIWVLERASDGARVTLTLSGQLVEGVSVGVGTAVTVTAITTGWVLSTASQAIALIPNEIGAALLYNERITR
jgi:hypothetical protein